MIGKRRFIFGKAFKIFNNKNYDINY